VANFLFPPGGTKADKNQQKPIQFQALPKIKCAHLDGRFLRVLLESYNKSKLCDVLAETEMDESKFIAYVPVGDAKPTATNPRAVNLPRAAQGIYDFNDLVEGPMLLLYKRGFRRFLLWQPFGLTYPPGCFSNACLPPWKYVLNGIHGSYRTPQNVDDWLNLIDLNYPPYQRMINTFVHAINHFKKELRDAEIIVYNGTAFGNPRFRSLNQSQVTTRLNVALSPVFETYCHLAFDTACLIPPEHWLPKYFSHIDDRGLHVFVEAAPWRYEYLKMRGFVCALEQLKNVNPASCRAQIPTSANGGFVGFLDPTEVMGERIGALFGGPPARFTSSLQWYSQIVPRAFNAGQIDAIVLHQNPFLGPPYSAEAISLEGLTADLVKTTESNYADFLA